MRDLTYSEKNYMNFINRVVAANRLSHSYLIEIEDYEKDLKHIYSFVKLILCQNKTEYENLNCGKCNICQLIDDENYPDLEVIDPMGAWIKKSQLLELKSEYQNKSLLGNKRIYLIKEAEKLNAASANTILKFLEEPEDDIIAILITNNRYSILETILSRCQVLSLKNNLLKIEVEDKVIEFIQFLVQGPELFIHYKSICESILIDKENTKKVFCDVENVFIYFLNYKAKLEGFLLNEKLAFLNECENQQILSYISIIEEEISKLMYNVNYKLWLDTIFSRFVEVK